MDLEEEDAKNAVLANENSKVYLPEDSYYKTCCGKVHVETGAKYIAIVSLALLILSMLFGAYLAFEIISGPRFGSTYWLTVLSFIWNGVKISCCVCILVAIKKRIAGFYWPFLIMNGWMEMVVYKAYKFMLYHHNGSHNRMMQYNNQIFSDDPIKV
ncbi:hypothetical protein Ddc_21137 [Ditylenchus destructor]|nr:hypothetical protein Ddc_21137 [Ditylenchus destructor]